MEEDYVAAAIERAVDSGAKVISISLGYRDGFTDGSPDYPLCLDGRPHPALLPGRPGRRAPGCPGGGRGGQCRSRPGPALAHPRGPRRRGQHPGRGHGGRRTAAHCPYSCTGPSADGRIKPDIVSMGPVPACNVSVALTASPRARLLRGRAPAMEPRSSPASPPWSARSARASMPRRRARPSSPPATGPPARIPWWATDSPTPGRPCTVPDRRRPRRAAAWPWSTTRADGFPYWWHGPRARGRGGSWWPTRRAVSLPVTRRNAGARLLAGAGSGPAEGRLPGSGEAPGLRARPFRS